MSFGLQHTPCSIFFLMCSTSLFDFKGENNTDQLSVFSLRFSKYVPLTILQKKYVTKKSA